MKSVDLVIRGGKIVSPDRIVEASGAIAGEHIVADGHDDVMPPATRELRADGRYLLPGAIDSHVHFRDPGYALHRGWGFDETMSRAQLWQFAAQHGRRSVSGRTEGSEAGGRIAPGAPADLVLLDWDTLDDDPRFPAIDPLELLLARGHGGHVDEVIVSGRSVVRGGALATLDEPALRAELLAQVRSGLAAQPAFDPWRQTLVAMAEDLGPFYRRSAWTGCC